MIPRRDLSPSLEMTRVLVIADTHNKLPPMIGELAGEAEEIWHLGDVCRAAILDELRTFGPPVTLVRGNCDANFQWPSVLDLTRSGICFRLQHVPPGPRESVTGCDVLLHAHTHVPRDETIGGVRFLNPGCVTRPNRGAPPSVAFLTIREHGGIDWELRLVR
jgi:uncharacterized protein